MTYFIAVNVNARKKIESAKEDDRADILIRTAERLHLDLNKVPEKERAPLIKQVLKNRIIGQIIVSLTIIALGLLITYLVDKQIGRKENGYNNVTNPSLPFTKLDSFTFRKK
jgi:hypothetical protein